MMKKVLFGLSAILALFATSCQNELDTVAAGGDTSVVTFSIETPEIATRAYSDGETATVLHYALFDLETRNFETETGVYLSELKPNTWPTLTDKKGSVSFKLVTGNMYRVVFWAAAPNAPYTFDAENATVTVNYGEAAKCNDEKRDAFFACADFAVDGNKTIGVKLTRPFAQLNIGTNDYEDARKANVIPTKSQVTVKGIYSTLDLFTGDVAGEVDVTFASADIKKDETFPVAGYEYLAMNYLLVDDPTVVDVEFTCFDKVNTENPRNYTRTVGSVPVQRNYRTNIYGQILTSTADLDVEIKPGYNTPDSEVYPVVVDAAGLQKALNAAPSNVRTVISLARDIEGDVVDFQRADRDIVIDGGNNKFNGTIRIHNGSSYNNGTITIKNVNFETSTASINFIEALENGSERYSNNITVENCTFTATGAAVKTAVAVQVKATRGVTVTGCTATNMHSLIQAQSCDTGDVKVIDCTVNGKNGVAFKQVNSATVENTKITADEYGIRFDGNIANYGITVKNNNVTAKQPIIVRKMTGANNTIALEGNTLTTTENYQVIITKNSDDEAYDTPTGTYTLTGADEYYVYPRDVLASSSEAFAAAIMSDAKNIKIMLDDDIEVPISSLGQMTGGSGEYKLGGENTESILIDLNGKKLTITTTYWSVLGAKNENALFTIKNGTMTSSQASGTWNSYDLCFANCNYVFEDVVFEKAIALEGANKSYTLKDVTINETHDYYAMWISAKGQTVNIDGLTVNSAGRGIKIDEQYVNTPAKVTMNVADATFQTAKKAAILVKSAEGAEINWGADNNIANVADDPAFAVWVDEDSKDYADNVVVNGALSKVEGTSTVLVYTADDLNKLNATNAYVVLMADIDFQGAAMAKPIELWKNSTFDGQGHKISNVKTAVQGGYATSLFRGDANPGNKVVKNLVIENLTTPANYEYASAIWSDLQGANIEIDNVQINNSTISANGTIGGFVGFVSASSTSVVIKNSSINNTNLYGGEVAKKRGAVVGRAYGCQVNCESVTVNNVKINDVAATTETLVGDKGYTGTVTIK